MKANPRLRSTPRSIFTLPLSASAMLLAACVPQAAAPPPRPAPKPAPTPEPTLMPRTATGWRDAPITPGDWQWGMTNPGSTATFAGGLFVIRCDLQQRSVTLTRSGNAPAPITMTITTETGARTLATTPATTGIAVSLPARDPVLDAMALSRGRFAVEAPGTAPLYIPSWTEISRVVEDCR